MWGWIPNLSGKICSSENLDEQLNGDKFFKWNGSENKITASDKIGTIEIRPRGEGGICRLEMTVETNDPVVRNVWASKMWKRFRATLDSCSTGICLCTAMDNPVEDTEHVEASLANAFINTMEIISDSGAPSNNLHKFIRLTEEKKNTTKKEELENLKKRLKEWQTLFTSASNICNVSKTNKVYFDRFMDIYNDELKGARDNFKRIMDARYEKAEIIFEELLRRAEFEYKTLSGGIDRESLISIRGTLKFTIVAVIIAAGSAVIATLLSIFH